jgi:hypothetical protein
MGLGACQDMAVKRNIFFPARNETSVTLDNLKWCFCEYSNEVNASTTLWLCGLVRTLASFMAATGSCYWCFASICSLLSPIKCITLSQ